MPILAFVLLIAFVGAAAIVLLPLSLIQRYRVGTARRPARGWFIGLNLVAIAISTMLFLTAAAITRAWVPNAFVFTLIGFGGGCALGLLGLALTRWEATPQTLHYTPNAMLVLIVTLVVTARIVYGFWRSWHAWNAGLGSFGAAFGIAQSMAAGAVVLGYYLTYWMGVRRRLHRYRQGVGGHRR